MSFLKKMFDFNINDENFTEKEEREIDEIACICQPKSTPSFNWKVYHFE